MAYHEFYREDYNSKVLTPELLFSVTADEIENALFNLTLGPAMKRAYEPLTPEGKESISSFVDLLILFYSDSRLARMENKMNEVEIDSIPKTREERFNAIRQIATYVNKEPVLEASQLWAIANYHNQLGYYNTEYGVGKVENGRLVSAFNTPLEYNPFYREAYGKAILKAWDKLNEQKPFTPENPFSVFIFGDGNGRITAQAVKVLTEAGMDQACCRIVVGDKSNILLETQARNLTTDFESIMFIPTDARHLDTLLNQFERNRGVLIAGEELADDFPGYILKYDKNTGEPMYVTYHFTEKGLEIKKNLLDSENRVMFGGWIRTFKHYLSLLEKSIPDHKGIQPVLSFNIGLLQMIQSINNSNFEGYWMGGDYCGQYRSLNITIQPNSVSPVYTMGVTAGKRVKSDMDLALYDVANISTDVDPGLFKYASALGMQTEFAGEQGHFISLMLDGKPLERADLEKRLTQMRFDVGYRISNNMIAQTERRSKSTLLKLRTKASEIMSQSSDRINWIFSKGNVPSLLDDESHRTPAW